MFQILAYTITMESIEDQDPAILNSKVDVGSDAWMKDERTAFEAFLKQYRADGQVNREPVPDGNSTLPQVVIDAPPEPGPAAQDGVIGDAGILDSTVPMDTSDIAAGNKGPPAPLDPTSRARSGAMLPPGENINTGERTKCQNRLIKRTPVELCFQERITPKYTNLPLFKKASEASTLMNKIRTGADVSRESNLSLPPICKPDNFVVKVEMIGAHIPEPGTVYNAVRSYNETTVLSEARVIVPPDNVDSVTLPDFAESISSTHRGVWTNIIQGTDGPIKFIDNAFSYTSSVNVSHAQLEGRKAGLVKKNVPVLFLLGDQSLPELIDDGECMAVVLRCDDASFESLKILILRVFKTKSCAKGVGLIPQGSLILTCLPGLLQKMGQNAFNIQFEYFEAWAQAFFATGKNIDTDPMPDSKFLVRHGVVVIPVFPPTKSWRLSSMMAIQSTLTATRLAKYPPPFPLPPSV